MIGKNFDKQQRGKYIRASTINEPIAETERQSRMRTGRGLTQFNRGGIPYIQSTEPQEINARLIGFSGSGYQWQGIYPSAPGAWADLPANFSDQGVDYTTEVNGNNSAPTGSRVRMTRTGYRDGWVFQLDSCLCPTTPAPPGPSPSPAPQPQPVPPDAVPPLDYLMKTGGGASAGSGLLPRQPDVP